MINNYFRAYSVDGKFHYGEILVEETMQATPREVDKRYFIREKSCSDWGLPYRYVAVEVMGSTVRAYSNLSCKNKMGIPVKIFEGDKVKCANKIYEVTYNFNKNCWTLQNPHSCKYFTKDIASKCIFIE